MTDNDWSFFDYNTLNWVVNDGSLFINIFAKDKESSKSKLRNTLVRVHQNFMYALKNRIYNQLKLFDIKESEASQRSFLLYPFRFYISAKIEGFNQHANVAGEFRRVSGAIRNNRPVWRHVNNAFEFDHFNGSWRLIRTSDRSTIARSVMTSKNMLLESLYFQQNGVYYIH